MLQLSRSAIYGMVAKGELPHFKLGGAIRFSEADLVAYLESRRVERTKKAPRSPSPSAHF